MEPLAGTREHSNVYVKHYRQLRGLIGDGMFVFVFVMYVCSYEIDKNFCENFKSFAGLAEEAPRGGTKPEIADHFSNIAAYCIAEAIVNFSNPRGWLYLSRGLHLLSRGSHPELYDFAPSGLLLDWSNPLISRGSHPELYDFAPSGLLLDWSNPLISRGSHPELYDFAPSGLLHDWSDPLISRGLHPELYDFAPSGLLHDWSDPLISRGLHPELYDFAPSGLLHDWSDPGLSRGLHPELYDFAPSGLLNERSKPRVRPLEMTCRPMGTRI